MAKRRPPPRRKRRRTTADLEKELIDLAAEERYAEVIARCEKEPRRIPLSATCLHVCGVARTRFGDYDLAIEDLTLASARCQSDAAQSLAVRNDLSKAYYSAQRFDEAIEVLIQLADENPQQVEFARNLVLVLEKANQIDAARTRCQQAVRRWPDDAPLSFQLGDLMMASDSWQLAADAFSRCLKLAPDHQGARRRLVAAYRALGDSEKVIETLEAWLAHDPDNAVAEHLLSAQRSQKTAARQPERASDEYVREVFDQFADTFDSSLRSLGYRSPEMIASLLADHLRWDLPFRTVLDAGCGTGLMAEHLRPLAERLIGVDLSAGMLRHASDRGYDELVCRELVDYLEGQTHRFDLIVSADTLNYFGDLAPVFRAAHRALRCDASPLVFSLEMHDDRAQDQDRIRGYHLNPSGRYSHRVDYVRRALEASGFTIVSLDEAPMRHEAGQNVDGQYWIARRNRIPISMPADRHEHRDC